MCVFIILKTCFISCNIQLNQLITELKPYIVSNYFVGLDLNISNSSAKVCALSPFSSIKS